MSGLIPITQVQQGQKVLFPLRTQDVTLARLHGYTKRTCPLHNQVWTVKNANAPLEFNHLQRIIFSSNDAIATFAHHETPIIVPPESSRKKALMRNYSIRCDSDISDLPDPVFKRRLFLHTKDVPEVYVLTDNQVVNNETVQKIIDNIAITGEAYKKSGLGHKYNYVVDRLMHAYCDDQKVRV